MEEGEEEEEKEEEEEEEKASLEKKSYLFLCLGDVAVSGGNAGWTASTNGQPCLHHKCSHWPPAEKTKKKISAESSSLNPPDDPIGRGTELN